MLKMRFKWPLLAVAGCFILAMACRKKDPPQEPVNPAVFDKQGMLVNYADKVILPDYNNFSTALDSLLAAYNAFTLNPGNSTLQEVKNNYHAAYSRYQHISPYEFGPAENAVVRMNFNVFPTDTVQIEANIASGSYDMAAVSNLDAKGFPALDYLFYAQSEQATVSAFTAEANRKKYGADVMADMRIRLNTVVASWNSSYRSTFVNSLGTDVGSSIGFLVNQVNFELDYLKNAKVGIPLGKKSLGVAMPEQCEALYSGFSVEFALETLDAIENIYRGRSEGGGDGKGFDDYLVHLDSRHVNGSLHAAIDQQFTVAREKLQAIPDPLKDQVINNAAVVDAAHTELLKLLVLLKTDMPSALGVVITYQDGDGD